MSTKFDWKALVGTVAPTIATSLGGPLVGVATKWVANALGIEGEPATLDGQIESKLANATHADLLALKTADQEYEVSMRELDVKETGLHLTGMNDARETHKDRWEPFAIFCILTVVSCSGFVGIVEFSPGMSDATKGMLLPIYGALVYKWLDCVAYYVGTTRSSAAKTALLAK
jgi:hypothetical protein